MSEPINIPQPVRSAVLTRVERYGVRPAELGEELLMREGCGSFDDYVSKIRDRYGADEGERVRQ